MNTHRSFSRREFINTSTKAAAAGMLVPPLIQPLHAATVTVGDIMDAFISEVPGAPFPGTVDTLKAGNREIEVTGVVTTMFATIAVIRRAMDLESNFIIAHEPTYYNHFDETDWLENDPAYQLKRKLLEDNGIAIWRNHDYIHSHEPDGVYSVLLDKLGWQNYMVDGRPSTLEIPASTLSELITHAKNSLGIAMVRYLGDPAQVCRKVLLMPGAMGGENQIRIISREQPDLVIIGEAQEWTTPEYIRDVRASGKNISLIVLGHSDSEDPGSIYMQHWLNQKFPQVNSTHIHSGNPFRFA